MEERIPVILMLCLMIAAVALYQLSLPIAMGDTDMWFHLNGGRYFFEQGKVPSSDFYTPHDEATWFNYYWGFQVLLYWVHSHFGYQGLLFLRAALVIASVSIIAMVIMSNLSGSRQRWLGLMLFAIAISILIARDNQLRPHLFSYLLIPSFIYILEFRPRLAPLLPLLIIFWANLHGIEWPVPAVICAAYFLEGLAVNSRQETDLPRRNKVYLLSILACLPALFVNPWGINILVTPLAIPPGMYQFVTELRLFSFGSLREIQLNLPYLTWHSVQSLMLIISALAFVWCGLRLKLRYAHLLMAAVGAALLLKGVRFTSEFTLLSLPLIRHAITTLSQHRARPVGNPLGVALALIILTTPFSIFYNSSNSRGNWPFDDSRLPIETTDFLKAHHVEGNILANPSVGGWLEWALYPEIKNFADLQAPPINDWDVYRAFTAFNDPTAMRRLLKTYDIGLLLFPLTGNLKALEKLDNFIPVHISRGRVLYADRHRYPELTAKYGIDPHIAPNALTKSSLPVDEHLALLEKTLRSHPESIDIMQAIAAVLIREKRWTRALAASVRIIRHQPGNHTAQLFAGTSYKALKQYDKAIPLLTQAMLAQEPKMRIAAINALGECYAMQGNYPIAYDLFSSSINLYRQVPKNQPLFLYAKSAIGIGKVEQGRTLLQQLLFKLPDTEIELKNQAESLLAKLPPAQHNAKDTMTFVKRYLAKFSG